MSGNLEYAANGISAGAISALSSCGPHCYVGLEEGVIVYDMGQKTTLSSMSNGRLSMGFAIHAAVLSHLEWATDAAAAAEEPLKHLIIGEESGTITVWRDSLPNDGPVQSKELQLAGHRSRIVSVFATHPEGTVAEKLGNSSLISCSSDGELRLWDLRTSYDVTLLSVDYRRLIEVVEALAAVTGMEHMSAKRIVNAAMGNAGTMKGGAGKVVNEAPLARHEADSLARALDRAGGKARLVASHDRSSTCMQSLGAGEALTVEAHYAIVVTTEEPHAEAIFDSRPPLRRAGQTLKGVALHDMRVDSGSGSIFTASDSHHPVRMWQWDDAHGTTPGQLKLRRWFHAGLYLPSLDKRWASLCVSTGPARRKRTIKAASPTLVPRPGGRPSHSCELCVEAEPEVPEAEEEEAGAWLVSGEDGLHTGDFLFSLSGGLLMQWQLAPSMPIEILNEAGEAITDETPCLPGQGLQCSACRGWYPHLKLRSHWLLQHPAMEEEQRKCRYTCGVGPCLESLVSAHEALDCVWRPVSCPFLCGVRLAFCEMPRHVKDECPQRVVPCQLGCAQQGLVAMGEGQHYEEECPCRVVECGLGCGWDQIQYRQLEQHAVELCPKRIAVCEACELPTTAERLAHHQLVQCPRRIRACPYPCGTSHPDQDLAAHKLKCECRPILCSLKCGQVFEARRMANHERNACTWRPWTCPDHCGQRLTIKESADHPRVCRERITPCPNSCGKQLKAKTLPAHRPACTHRIVPCPLGCGDPAIRNVHLPQHIELCPHRDEMCPLGCRSVPFKACEIEAHATLECSERMVPCPSECGEEFKARSVASHLASTCPRRLVPCIHCGCKGFNLETVAVHETDCGMRPAECPLHCGTPGLLISNLEQHQNLRCPQRISECKYGCGVTRKAFELPPHHTACPLRETPGGRAHAFAILHEGTPEERKAATREIGAVLAAMTPEERRKTLASMSPEDKTALLGPVLPRKAERVERPDDEEEDASDYLLQQKHFAPRVQPIREWYHGNLC